MKTNTAFRNFPLPKGAGVVCEDEVGRPPEKIHDLGHARRRPICQASPPQTRAIPPLRTLVGIPQFMPSQVSTQAS